MKNPKLQKKKRKPVTPRKAGLSPGSLVHIGKVKTELTMIDVVQFKNEYYKEDKNVTIDKIPDYLSQDRNTWIQVTGLQDTKIIGELGKIFKIHPLVIEDILNTEHHPKVDFIDDQAIFLTIKTFQNNSKEYDLDSDQVSLLLFKNVLISFHETPLPLYDPIIERMQLPEGRLRTRGVDYLFYALIDVIVDNYYVVIEKTGDFIDNLEDAIFDETAHDVLESIQFLKKDLLFIKKSVFPLREALSTLIKIETPLIDQLQIRYLNDVYDHLMQIYENIESFRDLNSGLKDIYLSTLSNKMNQIMKLLTIISTIFIPLTFIVGLYGMNFKYMPELEMKYGYLFVWITMLIISGLMIRWFAKKKWF
jgi:magnesium transporter